jgi:hypothetical protein
MTEHICKKCGEAYLGGKGGAKGLCARCYQRERRGTPQIEGLHKQAGVVKHGVISALRMPAALAKKVEQLAGREGVAVSQWIRRAIEEAVRRGSP